MKPNHLLALFIITLLFSCSEEKGCDNRFLFVSAHEPDSLFKLDFTIDPFNHLDEMNEFYKTDLCKDCKKVTYCTPLEIEGKMGYLPILAEFDHSFCPNCPLYMRIRNSFQILINANHDLLVEGEPCQLDSLSSFITDHLSNIQKEDTSPDYFYRVIYSLNIDSGVEHKFTESVLAVIYSSHLNFIENKLVQSNIQFCDLSKEEVLELRKEYPINIEMYRKTTPPPPPPFIHYLEILSSEWAFNGESYLTMNKDSLYDEIAVSDTSKFSDYILNKTYHKELNDSIHVKKSISFNPRNGSKISETDFYTRPITPDLESQLTMTFNFIKREYTSFYIDTIGSEAKKETNRKKLDDLKNDSTKDDYYICGTSYLRMLWEDIPAFAVPKEIPGDSALNILKQWKGYSKTFLGE